MPKAKRGKKVARPTPLEDPATFLYNMEWDALQLACARLGVPFTNLEGSIAAIKQHKNGVRDVARMRTTAKFASQLEKWEHLGRCGFEPTLEKVEACWVFDLLDDELRMMCTFIGLEMGGDRDALISRLVHVENLGVYKRWLSTSIWADRMSKCEEWFAKYTPDAQSAHQTQFSHIPTTEPSRQAWIGTD